MITAAWAAFGSVSQSCGLSADPAEEDVDRPVERVEEPQQQQGVRHVGDDRRQVRGRPVRARAAEALVQQQCEEERAHDPERHRERDVDERVAERLPEDLVVDQLLEVVEPDPTAET